MAQPERLDTPEDQLKAVYRAYENGRTPDNVVRRDESGVSNVVLTGSQTLVAAKTADSSYLVARIKPRHESRQQTYHRQLLSPHTTDTTPQFKGCDVQFLHIDAPEVRSADDYEVDRTLHTVCHWRSQAATPYVSVHSPRALLQLWRDKYLRAVETAN